MSQQNVEIVKRIYAAPLTSLAFEFYSADVEWDMTNSAGWPDEPVYHGHAGVRKMMRGWIASFDRWEPTVERAMALGDDVIAVVSDRAYMRGSTRPMLRRTA